MTKKTKTIMIYVQHLLGIGHLRRISFLANGLAKRHFKVSLVSGGRPVSDLTLNNVTLHQLPSVRSLDGTFNQLIDEHHQIIDQNWKQLRKDKLLTLFNKISPDALITETYPFGRRMMRFELIPLLDAAINSDKKPVIISSIRDILQPKSKPERNEEINQLLHQYYSKVMVHGDPSVAQLSASYPLASNIQGKTVYTGYITHFNAQKQTSNAGLNEIIVSGGGGAASLNLLQTAIEANALSPLKGCTWRLLVGNNINHETFSQLQTFASKNLIIERNRSDFSTLLKNCTVSVSQAGYNTVMDILQNRTKAVLVPFAENGEVEQTIRAQLLNNIHRVVSMTEETMTPSRLAEAIIYAANMPQQTTPFKMNGVDKSADIIEEWLNV